MIKKPWGVQTDDGREGMMNPNQKTSWHLHEKRTRVFACGLLYVIEKIECDIRVRFVPAGGLTIEEMVPHCLFSCGEMVTFNESGTDIAKDIERLPWPKWCDKIISGIRDSHMPDLPEIPTEGYGKRDVSQITNDADVTTSK